MGPRDSDSFSRKNVMQAWQAALGESAFSVGGISENVVFLFLVVYKIYQK